MSNFREVIDSAITYGFYLDSCGEPERHYSWGSWIDLCGMSVEEAMKGAEGGGDQGGGEGGDTAKTKNTITFLMQKGGDGEYSLYITAAHAPESDVLISFTMDGEQRIVTLPAGVTSYNTGLKGEDAEKPYSIITNASTSSDDEKYEYTVKNSVSTGYFTLTVTKNGVKTTEQVKYGTEVPLTGAEEREGYDFVWTDGNGNILEGDTFEMPEDNASINGSYVPKSYTLTYTISKEVLDNGSIRVDVEETNTITVKYDEKVLGYLRNLAPQQEGYTFSGWEMNGEAVTENTKVPAGDFSVDSLYKLNQHTFKYVVDGNETSYVLYYGQEVPSMSIPEKTGYNIIGWDNPVPATMPDNDVTVTARYEAIDYYVIYSVDGVEMYRDAYHYEDAVEPRADEAKEGYTFSGWSEIPATMPANDVNVTGSFSVNSYELRYVIYVNGTQEGSEPYSAFSVDYGTELTPIDAPAAREGYSFTGWTGLPATMPAHDVEVRGDYSVNSYTLTLMNGEDVFMEISGEYGEALPEVGTPEKTGYTFTGWDPELPATIPAGDITYNAVYEINSYVLSYYVDGVLVESAETEYNSVITPKEDPEKEGHTFSGWDNVPERMPAEDVDVHGTFSVNTYSLSYYVDGELYSESFVEYGAQITPESEPEKIGYTFSGWDNVPATMPARDVVVNGTFSINYYVLSYYVDGALLSSGEVEYNAVIEAAAAPEKTGYTFSGWDNVPERMPAEDVDVTGRFIINQYTMTFLVDGETFETITQDYGTPVSANTPDKVGYTFDGWVPAVPATMPAEDMTFNAEFTINQYTLSFFIDGNAYTSLTQDYGTAVAEPVPDPVVGYTFSGWDPVVPATMPASSMTFNGAMNINSWTATYFIDGNQYSSVTYEYGAEIVYPDVPLSGYVLNWTKEYVTMPDEDITINGTYEEYVPPKTIYYGMIYTSGETTFADVESIDNYEYVAGQPAAVNFVIPADPEYGEIEDLYNEDEISDEEWEAWLEAHNYSYIIFVPSHATLSSIKNGIGAEILGGFTQRAEMTTIDDTKYRVYTRNSGACGKRKDVTYQTTIKIDE